MLKGRKLSSEHRENIRKAEAKKTFAKRALTRAAWRNPTKRKRMLRGQKRGGYGWKGLKGEKRRRKMSVQMKRTWNSPSGNVIRRALLQTLQEVAYPPSEIQTILWRSLSRFGFKLEYPVRRYLLDIAHPGKKIDVEVDGAYWHRNCKSKDKTRDQILKKHGWRILRIPAGKLSDLSFRKAVVERIAGLL